MCIFETNAEGSLYIYIIIRNFIFIDNTNICTYECTYEYMLVPGELDLNINCAQIRFI